MTSVERTAVRDIIGRLDRTGLVPDADDLERVLSAAQDRLDNEDPAIRPRDGKGRPGGMILLDPNLPTLIVPDLHARTAYITALLDMPVNTGGTVLDGLIAGSLQIVCVGDGFHSEGRGAGRWKRAWQEYNARFAVHEAMDGEMSESLSLMAMVMVLKTTFPSHFHFLKGNHENVANAETGGNRPFGKYAWEGQMVRTWFLEFLGSDLLDRWARFENSLPLLAVGGRFLVSHAEPRRFYARDRIIGYRDDDRLIFDFTWTGNDEAEEGSVLRMLEHYLGTDATGALYFGGHRPIRGRFAMRASGLYVQIHNPDAHIVAVLPPGIDPDPDRDIRIVDGASW